MIKLYGTNELRLDRTLQGLATRLAGQQGEVAVAVAALDTMIPKDG